MYLMTFGYFPIKVTISIMKFPAGHLCTVSNISGCAPAETLAIFLDTKYYKVAFIYCTAETETLLNSNKSHNCMISFSPLHI